MNSAIASTDAAVEHTLKYIDVLARNLKILEEPGCRPIFFPDRIVPSDIDRLRHELNDVLETGHHAIEAVRVNSGRYRAVLGFGLVDDFELFVKTGYLIGNRVVLWDIIRSVVLTRTSFTSDDIISLGAMANGIVSLRQLAQSGAAVVLPHPRTWSEVAVEATHRTLAVAKTGPDASKSVGLAVALAVCDDLNLNLYTIAESDETWQAITAGRTISQTTSASTDEHVYRSLLTALVAERLLSDDRLEFVADVPLDRFQAVISSRYAFYQELSAYLTSGGRTAAKSNADALAKDVHSAIDSSWRADISNTADNVELLSKGTELAAIFSVLPPPLAVLAKVLGNSAKLVGSGFRGENSSSALVSVFKLLSQQRRYGVSQFSPER